LSSTPNSATHYILGTKLASRNTFAMSKRDLLSAPTGPTGDERWLEKLPFLEWGGRGEQLYISKIERTYVRLPEQI